MTTIAWDGKVLAADTLMTEGGHLKGKARKLFRLSDGSICAGAGNYREVISAVEYLNNPDPEQEVPDFESSCLIRIYPDRTVKLVVEKLVHLPVITESIAEGSGKEFAMTALHLGLDAVQAVKLASELDVYTGSEIETMTLEDRETEISKSD